MLSFQTNKTKKNKNFKNRHNKSKIAKQLNIISTVQSGGNCGTIPDVSKYYNPLNLNDSLDGGYVNIFERTFYPRAQDVGVEVPSSQATVNQQANLELGKQTGGGYTFNLNNQLGNQPEIVGYPECCPPVYQNQEMYTSNNLTPMCGAGRKLNKYTKSRRMVKSNSRRKSKSRKNKKNNNKNNNQSGGNQSEFNNNNPPNDLVSENMNQRSFDCKTPNWNQTCI